MGTLKAMARSWTFFVFGQVRPLSHEATADWVTSHFFASWACVSSQFFRRVRMALPTVP